MDYAASFKKNKNFGKNKSFELTEHLLLVLRQCNGFLKMRKQYNKIFFSLYHSTKIYNCEYVTTSHVLCRSKKTQTTSVLNTDNLE